MSYDFSFSKKTLTYAGVGFAFVGILLFVAGLLIGTSWKAEPNAAANVAGTKPAALPATQPVTAPQEPVLKADVATPEAGAAPGSASVSDNASSSIKQAHSDGSGAEAKSGQGSTPPPNDGEVKIIQEADSSTSEAADTPAFSVQVGVFLSQNDAQQLVRQLQNKGYTPIVLAATDDEGRLWFSVRIGTYQNKTDATKAAVNIAMQEKLKAVVRPLESL
jgi:cell division septation protein DedD